MGFLRRQQICRRRKRADIFWSRKKWKSTCSLISSLTLFGILLLSAKTCVMSVMTRIGSGICGSFAAVASEIIFHDFCVKALCYCVSGSWSYVTGKIIFCFFWIRVFVVWELFTYFTLPTNTFLPRTEKYLRQKEKVVSTTTLFSLNPINCLFDQSHERLKTNRRYQQRCLYTTYKRTCQ
jgi:hypothetical protein